MAVEDMEAIGKFIAADSPEDAVSFIDELSDCFERIVAQPLVCSGCDYLAPNLRQAKRGKYLILFTPTDGTVVIERVVPIGHKVPPA